MSDDTDQTTWPAATQGAMYDALAAMMAPIRHLDGCLFIENGRMPCQCGFNDRVNVAFRQGKAALALADATCLQSAASERILLLHRRGDFWEADGDDAKVIAETLGLTLTKRDGKPMVGIPYHSRDASITALCEAGYAVEICPSQARDESTT